MDDRLERELEYNIKVYFKIIKLLFNIETVNQIT